MKASNIRIERYAGDSKLDITGFVTGLSWGGDSAAAYRSADISLMNTVTGHAPAFNITNGHQIRIYNGDTELFRGIVFKYSMNPTGEQTLTAYDYNYYLTKNSDNVRFDGAKASSIVRSLATKYGVKVGTVHDTGYAIPKLIFRGETIYDMMTIALTETEKKNGRTFALINKGGALNLLERKTQINRVQLDDDVNLLGADYSASIEDRKTAVKVASDDGSVSIVKSDSKAISAFGMMQHFESIDADKAGEAGTLSAGLLKAMNKTDEEFSVEVLGDFNVISGTAVVVNDRMRTVSGAFYVVTDTHTVDANGLHTMSLKLSRTLDIDRKDYVPPDEGITSTGGSGSGSGSGGNYTPTPSASGFITPASGRLSSRFGRRSVSIGSSNHQGVDIAANGTVPIRVAMDGVVTRSMSHSTYGEVIFVKHSYKGKTYETVYAHMRSGSRRYGVGKSVKQGDVLGYMGSTGRSSGQHLHFEIHVGGYGNPVNPLNYIKV